MIRFLVEFPDMRNNGKPHMESPIMVEAARSFNTIGAATLIIPDFIDRRSLRKNTRMRLWRRGLDGTTRLFGDTHWFLRRIKHSYREQTYTLEFEDALLLLNFRLVAYTSQTPYADKTLEEFGLITPDDTLRIDNMMRAYVRENYTAAALDAARVNTRIQVEDDRNLAPYGDQTAGWKVLGDVLKSLADMSAEKGLELFYDLVPQPDDTFMFKVWDKVRGTDRGSDSQSQLMLSQELNQLTEVEEIEDFGETATYVYVLGYDSGPSQVIVEQSNDIEIANDPFGRVEFTEEVPDVDVERVLENAGQAALQGRRPRRTVSARAVEGTGIVYDRDYTYGDRVMILVGSRKYNAHVRAVRSRWAEGWEDLEVRLDGYDEDAYPTFGNIPAEDENQAPIVNAGADQEVEEDEGTIPTPAPEEVWPLFGEISDDDEGTPGTWNVIATGMSMSFAATQTEAAVNNAVSYKAVAICAVANTKRIVLEGEWSASYVDEGGFTSSGINGDFNVPPSVDPEDDFLFVGPSANETTGDTFTMELTLIDDEDWPFNREQVEATPPTSLGGSVHFIFGLLSTHPAQTVSISLDLEVTEIEMDDGTIYTS